MKVAVLGSEGRMGQPTIFALNKLGHETVAMDAYDNSNVHSNYLKVDVTNIRSFKYKLQHIKPDFVISCLPYFLNIQVAHAVMDYGAGYSDLGGHVETSYIINCIANDNKSKYVITDLGLAPGLVNILALSFVEEHIDYKPFAVRMYCGGLPNQPGLCGILKYTNTWSIEGLINEYKDDCKILLNGEEITVRGMDGLENLIFNKEPREAFFTSGAASYSIKDMVDLGIKNCFYKTIRYCGHNHIAKFLIKDCNLGISACKKIFGRYNEQDDHVEIKIDVDRPGAKMSRYFRIDPKDGFSAMQVATGYSFASTIASISQTQEKVRSYKDLNKEIIFSNLRKFGIRL